MNISAILLSIQAGDRQAFAEVVTHYQRPLFGFLGRMGLSRGLAEDLAQETFLRAWRNLGKYDPDRGEFSTWLFTIAKNLALNELSGTANGREIPLAEDPPESTCDRPRPCEALALEQRRRSLHAALAKLPPAERCMIALAYTQDLELAQIAQIEGCTTGAVKTRLHRAKRKLYHLLEKEHA